MYFFPIGSTSVSLCRFIKCLMDMFIKTWMVTLFGMTNSVLYIMRSVKHPEKKCIIRKRGSVSTALHSYFSLMKQPLCHYTFAVNSLLGVFLKTSVLLVIMSQQSPWRAFVSCSQKKYAAFTC